MNHLKSYKIFESDNSIWEEMDDILNPITDNSITFNIKNSYINSSQRSFVVIKRDWNIFKNDERLFNISDVIDEVSHLCRRFPRLIKEVKIFVRSGTVPEVYSPDELVSIYLHQGFLTSIVDIYMLSITINMRKDGAESLNFKGHRQ